MQDNNNIPKGDGPAFCSNCEAQWDSVPLAMTDGRGHLESCPNCPGEEPFPRWTCRSTLKRGSTTTWATGEAIYPGGSERISRAARAIEAILDRED